MKNKIRACFNKSANSYDQHCAIQRQACSNLIALLQPWNLNDSIIVDLACGTGVSTQYIINYLKFQKIYAIDFCENLLEKARQKIKSHATEFVLSDFDLKIFPENSIDLVFCNMGLQWSFNFQNTLQVINSYLKKHGHILPHQTIALMKTIKCKNSFKKRKVCQTGIR